MAIGRISGPMLFSNLDRQGVDLAFDSNLVYLDVTNRRVGINNASPQYSLDNPGNVRLANILIQGNSISSNTGVVDLGSISNITIAGGSSNYVIYTDGNGNLAWGQISDLDVSWGNLLLANNTISITNTDGNLVLLANGSGSVTTTNDFYAANVYATNITGVINSGSGNVTANLTGNITGTFGAFAGNLYSSWLEGNVVGSYGNFNTVNVNGTMTATGNVVAQKITSPINDLHISAGTENPNNIIRFDSVSAFDIPSGTTDERPPSPDYGYVRYNTDIGSIEWWGGSQWVAGSNLISTQQIVPDGSNTVYTLDQSTVENAVLVNINGTIQQAGSGAYSVSGNQITFAEVPLVTDIIEIRFLASGVAALTFNFANIASNVSPSANVTYDLGSPDYRWRDLWLSGNTINLGSASLSAVGNTIQLPAGSTVGGANVDVTAINANIAAVNANVVAANAAMISANTAMKTYVDEGLADALFVAGSYGNVVVAEYLYFDPLINSIRANLGAYQIYANASSDSYQTYANANVVAIQANLGAYQTYANANVAAFQANLGAYQTYANANTAAFQAYANTKIGTNTNSNLVVVSNTSSTSTTTGALVVRGGVGVAGNINVGSGSGNAIVANGNVVVTGSLIIAGTGGGVIPPGGIIMWSGAEVNIPTGWLLCNGSNGTPDLRNRFVVGAGTGSSYAVGATGGSTDAVVVSHTHTATVTDPGHVHNPVPGWNFVSSPFSGDGTIDSSARTGPDEKNMGNVATTSSKTAISVSNSTEGSSGTNANLPPYYALCYIMKS
jgi:hypothetical protein